MDDLELRSRAAHEDAGAGALAKRRALLEQLRRILPPSAPWEAWLARTGELPPDFDALPACAELPNPLTRTVQGKAVPVATAEDWRARRAELLALFHQWLLGAVPPPPDRVRAETLGERREGGATVREVRLSFGPEGRASLGLELLIPPGPGPFPVFMTQHNHRAWALIALRRGYLACVYAGADSRDDTDSFLDAYPDYDWSRLTRRAWAASRCVDYLATVPEADGARIALTGHSRNGKQSLIAAALDERIAAVISSSSGVGGAATVRYCSEQHFGEGIELLTRVFPDWFHPRLRSFTGREDRLPVDLHELVALSAPRPCLLSVALNDGCDSTWAMQQTYLAAGRVYRLLGAAEHLRLLWRPGGHETDPTVIERYLDWCDTHFGRGVAPFPERPLHPDNWDAWRAANADLAGQGPPPAPDGAAPAGDRAAWEREREEVRDRVRWMLGEAPPAAANPGGGYGREVGHVAALLHRADPGEGVEKEQIVFGEYINGDIFLPAGLRASGRAAPAVLWLHPLSCPLGYVAAYKRGEQVFRTLARAGYAVFGFDQIGCGRRVEEAEGFYRRHPRWSLLGKMVRDAGAAIDALTAQPYVDAGRIWGLGYGLGSLVGTHLGALDGRLAGLVAVAGPPPFRGDTDSAGTGGIRRWSHRQLLLPRLGLFAGREGQVPYDTEHLYAAVAPRPLLVVSPLLDHEAPHGAVTGAVAAARRAYARHDTAEWLDQRSPEDYNHFGPEMQRLVLDWLRERDG